MNNQEKLLYLSGVAAEYLDYSGQCLTVPQQDRLQLLRLAGHDVESPDAVAAEIFELDARHWQQGLKPLSITSQLACIEFYSHPDHLHLTTRWELVTEQGTHLSGEVVPAELPEIGHYYIGELRYSARELALGEVELGYHQLTVYVAEQQTCASVYVCPERAFDVSSDAADEAEKFWGIGCQLYSLRSQRNWGIGDFSDLAELVTLAAAKGADIIGINPLHALCADEPNTVSPYSPSDRRFLNPLYIDVEAVAEFREAQALQKYCSSERFAARLQKLRSSDWVEHAEVSRIKYQVLELAYSYFVQYHVEKCSTRAQSFDNYVAEAGEALEQFARYEVRHNPNAQRHRDDPRFYCYLQWLAREQLEACQQAALAAGMRVGIMGDLAVGSVARGCEVAENAALYVPECAVGAPPDPFSSEGQNWGLPATNPVAMRRENFSHFIALLRANMASVGALRIDHVMSLQRLWWCLPQTAETSSKGIYVYYPIDALLPILCLESQRNQCVIVGEDLGVVSAEVREAMHRTGVYGNDLFYFTQHLDGRFWSPQERRAEALLSVTNHDVPTLADWWSEEDLQRRYHLGVITDALEFDTLCRERDRDKRSLLQWLADNALLPEGRGDADLDTPLDMPMCESIHRACARSASRFMLLQLEDLQLLSLPINIPATSHEYPNWRRKQTLTTADIFSGEAAAQLLNAVNGERKK